MRVSSRTGPQLNSLLAWPADRRSKRAHAREHFLEMERLGDVVVGSGIEALHLVAPAVARGEHEHRHGASGAAPGFQDRDAVHFRQADIKNDRVVGLGLAEIMAFLAIEGAIDDIAGVGQRSGELAIEVGIVLDHEEAQGIILHSRAGMKLATDGVNGCVDHFATAAKQSQHIDEFLVAPAQARPHHLGVFAVLAQRFDGLGERNRPIGIDRGALFGLGETGVVAGSVGGDGRKAHGAEQQDGRKKSGNRHGRGVNGAPVNAG